MVIPVNILDTTTCDEAVTAIEEGADVLVLTTDRNNIIHLKTTAMDTACVERLFSAIDDDETKKSLLRARNSAAFKPLFIAFIQQNEAPELLAYLFELAWSLGILGELLGKHVQYFGEVFTSLLKSQDPNYSELRFQINKIQIK